MPSFIPPVVLLLLLLAPSAAAQELQERTFQETDTQPPAEIPPARRGTTRDTYHGVEVHDPYRWLEDLASTETRHWAKAQDDFAAAQLDGTLAYQRAARSLARLTEMKRYGGGVIQRGERLFLTRTEGVNINGMAHLMQRGKTLIPLVESRRLFPDGERRVSASRAVSPDGEIFAYGTATTGSRWIRMRLMTTEKPRDLEEIGGLYSSYSSVGWAPDEASPHGWGFYYVRFPEPKVGEEMTAKPQGGSLFYHRVGTPQSTDEKVFDPEDAQASIVPSVSDDGQYLLLRAARAGDPSVSYRVRPLKGSQGWMELAKVPDGRLNYVGNDGSRFFFHTDRGAPRGRVIAVVPGEREWQEVLGEPVCREQKTETEGSRDLCGVMQRVDLVADRFIVNTMEMAMPQVFLYDLKGELEREVELPVLGMMWSGFAGRKQDESAYFSLSHVVDPGSVYRLDPQTGKVEMVLKSDTPMNPQAFITRQVTYRSSDGALVPMFLVHDKNLDLSKKHPVFLYGYGAYGWVGFPWFQPHVATWLENGGIYALAGLRGGGEHGDAWHEAGRRRNKERTIEDYLSAASWLVESHTTSPNMLVANGGSASGVVAAAAMVRRPEGFGAILVDIPALDMVRHEQSPRGDYWVPEFGTVADADDFKALHAYSPYHHLEAGKCYPPTLLTVGERDEVTPPWHGYKFTARLQRSTALAKECREQSSVGGGLLQVVWGEGHSFGTTPEQTVQTWARQLAFLELALSLTN